MAKSTQLHVDAEPKAGAKSEAEVAVEAPFGARRELLAMEVLEKAAVLFAGKGFAATSLKDVADAVGLSRSSIYYYYPSKDALLSELIQGVTLPVANIFREVDQEALRPIAAVREVVRRLVIWVADPRTHFRLMDRSEADLPEAILKVHVEAKRRVLSEMMTLIERAVAAGEARPVELRIAALSLIGMAMWTAWWFQPGHGVTLEEVANMVADNALATLIRQDAADKPTTIAGLARNIREDLAQIERMAIPS